MLSFGWSEIALTIVIIVIIVGPKEIPNLLRQLGSFSKSIKKISREFKSSLNEIADEGDLKSVKDSINNIHVSGLINVNEKYVLREIIFKSKDIYNVENIDKSRNKC